MESLFFGGVNMETHKDELIEQACNGDLWTREDNLYKQGNPDLIDYKASRDMSILKAIELGDEHYVLMPDYL